ncbi:TetR/AcrR family transcriptional regulator [Georgenia sp. SYP-B2076]|uniref:TetR/AcrR family transcriptional regulator n=1 Tax=Georgenia sp. SYP-B2076 TaxID=2495881 RepID=UPI00197AEC95|nr:TetR/AcrR family transcriptional regulator [Georgenia sp. SYP-B2076]
MSPPTTKRVATRQRFVDTAMTLFRDLGYGSTSMAQIAQAAEGSRANLYLYFSSKAQIVIARMLEIESELRSLYDSLDSLEEYTLDSLVAWLGESRRMWLTYRAEFEAMIQAMSVDGEVRESWLATSRRVCRSMTAPYRGCTSAAERLDAEVHMMTLMAGLEHNFSLLYVHGYTADEERVLKALAKQWLPLFGTAGR